MISQAYTREHMNSEFMNTVPSEVPHMSSYNCPYHVVHSVQLTGDCNEKVISPLDPLSKSTAWNV